MNQAEESTLDLTETEKLEKSLAGGGRPAWGETVASGAARRRSEVSSQYGGREGGGMALPAPGPAGHTSFL
jgi:hypothetical protein